MANIYSTVVANYNNADHVRAIAQMMQGYSGDVMGGGEALPEQHCLKIAGALQDFGNAVTVLALDEKNKGVGLATSIKSFSTFMLKPILNLHDVFVDEQWRGKSVGLALLETTERVALEMGCCKLTLEVLSNNHAAQSLYRKYGFRPYELAEGAGQALFWQKSL